VTIVGITAVVRLVKYSVDEVRNRLVVVSVSVVVVRDVSVVWDVSVV
jgi:hypothetical protein